MIKRLFLDIEVSPNIGMFWNSGHKISVGYESIIKEKAIICVCYSWEQEKEVHELRWDKKQDDKKLISSIVKVIEEADEVVGHNIRKFDFPFIKGRALLHGIVIDPYVKLVDTLTISRSNFRLNSHRLDYIGKYLSLGGKISTSYSMWVNILLKNSKEDMNNMVKYCKEDVIQLKKAYERFKNYIKPVSSVDKEFVSSCPECGSHNTIVNQDRILASGGRTVTRKCRDCGKYFSISKKKDETTLQVKTNDSRRAKRVGGPRVKKSEGKIRGVKKTKQRARNASK